MCGINGIYNLNQVESPAEVIQAMCARSKHRGPDNTGTFVDDRVALGQNRLSIIDLSEEANQPFISDDQTKILVFNGEIYNFRQLRQKLANRQFKTESDTETLMVAFEEWGVECLNKLNGMFAFALWEQDKQQLLVARDRLGIKPLYYYQRQSQLIFSSELRSLLASGLVPRKLNRDGLADYLRYQTVHAPNSIVSDVKVLMPGSYMVINADGRQTKSYWDIETDASYRSKKQNEDEIRKEVRQLFFDSVNRRLVADVPFGAFLSGGIDSSAIVAMMAQASKSPVKTFSVTFAEEEFSEAKYARQIAEKFKTDHTEIKLSPEDFLKELPNALNAMDHPSGDGPNSYIVSKVTKAHGVTMALSGLGGDELFGGYGIFKRAQKLKRLRWLFTIPRPLRKFIGGIFKRFRSSTASDKIQSILCLANSSVSSFYPLARQVYQDNIVRELLGIDELEMNADARVASWKQNGTPYLSRVSCLEIETYMQNVLLRDTDQMSMSHALEVRVPFLDHELVEYIYGICDSVKDPITPKRLLVESLGDLLPNEIVHREKMGFTFPWARWMKNELKSFCEEQLNTLKRNDIFNSNAVEDLWIRFLNGDKRISWSRVWILVVLGFWVNANNIEGK
jgi:asparagine synthase (glutamine-hydrolysing)